MMSKLPTLTDNHIFKAEKTVTGNSDLPRYKHRATCVCYNTAGYTTKY